MHNLPNTLVGSNMPTTRAGGASFDCGPQSPNGVAYTPTKITLPPQNLASSPNSRPPSDNSEGAWAFSTPKKNRARKQTKQPSSERLIRQEVDNVAFNTRTRTARRNQLAKNNYPLPLHQGRTTKQPTKEILLNVTDILGKLSIEELGSSTSSLPNNQISPKNSPNIPPPTPPSHPLAPQGPE